MTDYSNDQLPEKARSQLDRFEALAERMARCAEAVSNPTYAVYLQRGDGGLKLLETVAVRMTAGQIIMTVKMPGEQPEPRGQSAAIAQEQAFRDRLIQR
jgi:hypothetical protein